jgi:hypothetical protein
VEINLDKAALTAGKLKQLFEVKGYIGLQRLLHISIRRFLAKHVPEFILVKHLTLDLKVPVFLTLRIMSFMTVANLSSLLATRDDDCQIFRRIFTENFAILISLFPFLFRYYGGCISLGKKRHYSILRYFKLTWRGWKTMQLGVPGHRFLVVVGTA